MKMPLTCNQYQVLIATMPLCSDQNIICTPVKLNMVLQSNDLFIVHLFTCSLIHDLFMVHGSGFEFWIGQSLGFTVGHRCVGSEQIF